MPEKNRKYCIKIYHNDIEEVFPLKKHRYEIGSHVDADIRDATLMFMHAEITFEQGEWVVRKKNPYASVKFLENELVIKKLNDGDQIVLNGTTLCFATLDGMDRTEDTTLDDEASLLGLYTVRVLTGQDKGQEFTLRTAEYLLGRRCSAKGRRIEINDEYLSRDHARMTVTADYVLIEDLKSQNGIRIGMRRISREFISPPCTLIAGRTKIRIERIPQRSSKTLQTATSRTGFGSSILTAIMKGLGRR